MYSAFMRHRTFIPDNKLIFFNNLSVGEFIVMFQVVSSFVSFFLMKERVRRNKAYNIRICLYIIIGQLKLIIGHLKTIDIFII